MSYHVVFGLWTVHRPDLLIPNEGERLEPQFGSDLRFPIGYRYVPFGGFKDSSTNTFREQGDAAIDFFTKTKTIYRNY